MNKALFCATEKKKKTKNSANQLSKEDTVSTILKQHSFIHSTETICLMVLCSPPNSVAQVLTSSIFEYNCIWK